MICRMKPFLPGPVAGVIWKPLQKHHDERGWLCEMFRNDELPAELRPVMAYISETLPGVCRGPHEHRDQADYFCFLGPSTFDIHVWDNRPSSPTYWHYETTRVGADQPMILIVPPGVVHAYRNSGTVPGWTVNCPNQLYRGNGKRDAVDEIRHEIDEQSPFRLE